MAHFASIPIPSTHVPLHFQVTAAAASAAQVLPSLQWVITASDDATMTFGLTTAATPDANSMPLWGRTYLTGSTNLRTIDTIRVFNGGGATIDVWISPLANS